MSCFDTKHQFFKWQPTTILKCKLLSFFFFQNIDVYRYLVISHHSNGEYFSVIIEQLFDKNI